MFEQKTMDALLHALEKIEYGHITLTMPDGRVHQFHGVQDGPHADMQIHDSKAIRTMILRGSVGIADTYRAQKWDSSDLITFIEFALKNEACLDTYTNSNRIWALLARGLYFLRANTKRGSKRNIHAHYDLGNEFYKLWLDKSMTYSSALFQSPEDSLFDAQQNKYDRILSRLGDGTRRILEIGCGWGGFAERCTTHKNYHIDGITISNQQYDYARARLKDNDQATIRMRDYRDIQGKYDAVISIEMFEAVGERYWPIYFAKLKNALAQKGKAIIQTITIADARFENYRENSDVIRSYIFPGGMLASFSRFKQDAMRAGLKVTDQYTFGKDYAKTLALWLEQFDAKSKEIRNLNFDDTFIRLWRFYLASCSASFAVGNTNVMQIELRHA